MNIKTIIFVYAFILSFMSLQNSFSQSDYYIEKYFKSIETCLDTNADWEEMGCTYVRIEYPMFIDTKYSHTLNQLIKSAIHSFFFEKHYNNFDNFSEQFFQDYWKTQLEMVTTHWSNDTKVEIMDNTESLISMAFHNHDYRGGAHGWYRIRTLNFRKETNNVIFLDDIFDLNTSSKIELNRIFNNTLKNEIKKTDYQGIIKEIDFFNASNYSYDDIYKRFLINDQSLYIFLDYYDDMDGTRIGGSIDKIGIPLKLISHLIKINCPLNFFN